MKRLFSILAPVGVAALLLAASAALTNAEAQPGSCWKCVYHPEPQPNGTYACMPAADGLGNRSCTLVYGGCVLGSICGYYRRRPDGTYEESTPRTTRRAPRATSQVRGSAEGAPVRVASRAVDRGCNGAIVARYYDEGTSRRLLQATRAIRI